MMKGEDLDIQVFPHFVIEQHIRLYISMFTLVTVLDNNPKI